MSHDLACVKSCLGKINGINCNDRTADAEGNEKWFIISSQFCAVRHCSYALDFNESSFYVISLGRTKFHAQDARL